MSMVELTHTVTPIRAGVRLLRGIDFECSIYLVEGTDKALLIETGVGDCDLKAQVEQLTNLPLQVVTTHGHSDHAGGNASFPEVHMTRQAEADTQDAVVMNKPWITPQQWEAMSNAWEQHPCKPVYIDDGDVFDLGGKTLEVIGIPGHTAGCVALLDHQDRILFCGDCLVTAMNILMVVPTALTLDVYLASMRKLLSRCDEFDQIWTGHDVQAQPVQLLRDAVACAAGVVSGELVGEPVELEPVYGDTRAMRATVGLASILYRPGKIVEG